MQEILLQDLQSTGGASLGTLQAGCALCDLGGITELGLDDGGEATANQTQQTSEKKLAVIERNEGKCILCNLCVRTCEEVAGEGLLGLVGRGFGTVIKPEFRDSEKIAKCVDCCMCAAACPTGALKILK